MKINLSFILVVLTVAFSINSRNLFIRMEYNVPDFYKCFKETGNQNIMILYEEDPDKVFVTEIIKARNTGLYVDGLYYSCRNDSVDSVAKQMRQSFGTNIISTFWMIPLIQYVWQPKCSWENYNQEQNCQYLQDLISALKKYGFQGNVATDLDVWTFIFGSANACPEVGKSKLWWIPDDNEQSWQPDFRFYKKIGGWQKPYMKLYQQRSVCGEKMFVNYYQ